MELAFLGTAGALTTAHRDNTSLLVDNILVDCPGNVWGKMEQLGFDPLSLGSPKEGEHSRFSLERILRIW